MRFDYHIGLGGNIGDPAAQMTAALNQLDSHESCAVVGVSKLYKTPPWCKTDQPDFLNACAHIKSDFMPLDLLDECQRAEKAQNRVREVRWGPRTVDLDIILWSGGAFTSQRLDIPHPRFKSRAFVLLPLMDLDPESEMGPDRVSELLNELDQSDIEVLRDETWFDQARQP